MLKRFAFAAVVVAVVSASVGPAGAAGGATIEVFPVTFTISDGQCPNLPVGTTVEGEGTMCDR